MSKSAELEKLIKTVQKSAKYKHISVDLIRRIGTRELVVRRSSREAVKATKNKLHQVGGAYFETRVNWDRYLTLLKQAHATGSSDSVRQVCRQIMRSHTSTRERLEILDEFFVTILKSLPSICTVIDIACGLNPLALPWMPFDDQIEYLAYDIYGDMIGLVNRFLEMTGQKGRAKVRDVLSDPPTQKADLALILKTLPCLEQVDRDAAARLLETINVKYMLVSFPVSSLGGRDKGMHQTYETRFRTLVAGRDWKIERFAFATELAFFVQTE